MGEFIDINFNFDLFNKIITKKLAEYDTLKNLYFNGEDNGEIIYVEACKLIKLIEETIYFINYRQKIIDNKNLSESNMDEINKEKEMLNRLLLWYKKLKSSLNCEKEKYLSGEFGIELDF